MEMRKTLLLILLLTITGVLAQPGERPPMNIPQVAEPERQASTGEVFTITLVEYDRDGPGSHAPYFFPKALSHLVAFIQKSPEMDVDVRWNQLSLDSPGSSLWETSLLYLTGSSGSVRISDKGKEKLGQFLSTGGLLFAEEIFPSMSGPTPPSQGLSALGGVFEGQLKALIRDPLVLGDEGQKWKKVQDSHPLYGKPFRFPDGPPRGGALRGRIANLAVLELQGRAAVIFSNLNISSYWGDAQAGKRVRGLQFGANLIAFAMDQM